MRAAMCVQKNEGCLNLNKVCARKMQNVQALPCKNKNKIVKVRVLHARTTVCGGGARNVDPAKMPMVATTTKSVGVCVGSRIP